MENQNLSVELERVSRTNGALEAINAVLDWANKHSATLTEKAKDELIAIAIKYKDAQ